VEKAAARRPPIRVVLADDHPIWRDGVAADLGDRFEVVGMASDADEAIEVIREQRPDLVVCDLQMPGGGGIAVVKACGEATRIVILTVSEQERDLLDAVAAGRSATSPSPRRAMSCEDRCYGPPPANRCSVRRWRCWCSASSGGCPSRRRGPTR
jgi:DNA-binding NarL/FixJ family response regulator